MILTKTLPIGTDYWKRDVKVDHIDLYKHTNEELFGVKKLKKRIIYTKQWIIYAKSLKRLMLIETKK